VGGGDERACVQLPVSVAQKRRHEHSGQHVAGKYKRVGEGSKKDSKHVETGLKTRRDKFPLRPKIDACFVVDGGRVCAREPRVAKELLVIRARRKGGELGNGAATCRSKEVGAIV
jgi:hypothetical protein